MSRGLMMEVLHSGQTGHQDNPHRAMAGVLVWGKKTPIISLFKRHSNGIPIRVWTRSDTYVQENVSMGKEKSTGEGSTLQFQENRVSHGPKEASMTKHILMQDLELITFVAIQALPRNRGAMWPTR